MEQHLNEIDTILEMIHLHGGIDFGEYKKNTIHRRIGRRMMIHRMEALGDYIVYLKDHPEELSALYKDKLISVTRFFRDPQGFESLAAHLRALFERKQAQEAQQQLNATLEEKVAEHTRLAERRARQLKALAEELECAEGRERLRIAHLLHDDVQQILASARLRLQIVDSGRPSDTDIARMAILLDEAIATMRCLSHDLSSDVRRHTELEQGLQRLAHRMNEQHNLVVDLNTNLTREVTDELLKVFVLRTVGELPFNVVKHAGVKAALVLLTTAEDRLSIRVSDAGKGFNPSILENTGADTGIGC